MNLATRLRRALCRHDWLTVNNQWAAALGTDQKCWKCGHVRRGSRVMGT